MLSEFVDLSKQMLVLEFFTRSSTRISLCVPKTTFVQKVWRVSELRKYFLIEFLSALRVISRCSVLRYAQARRDHVVMWKHPLIPLPPSSTHHTKPHKGRSKLKIFCRTLFPYKILLPFSSLFFFSSSSVVKHTYNKKTGSSAFVRLAEGHSDELASPSFLFRGEGGKRKVLTWVGFRSRPPW